MAKKRKATGFYTKNGKVRPITTQVPHFGTRSTKTAHLSVPKMTMAQSTKYKDKIWNTTTGTSYMTYLVEVNPYQPNTVQQALTSLEAHLKRKRKGEFDITFVKKPSGSSIHRYLFKVEKKKKQPSLKPEMKDEKEGNIDYLKKAEAFRKAGDPVAADELERIARQEREHLQTLKEIEGDSKLQKPKPILLGETDRMLVYANFPKGFYIVRRWDDGTGEKWAHFYPRKDGELPKPFPTKNAAEAYLKKWGKDGKKIISSIEASNYPVPKRY